MFYYVVRVHLILEFLIFCIMLNISVFIKKQSRQMEKTFKKTYSFGSLSQAAPGEIAPPCPPHHPYRTSLM
jgi:hypothetical protein